MSASVTLRCDADAGDDQTCGAQRELPAESAAAARELASARHGWTYTEGGDRCDQHSRTRVLPLLTTGWPLDGY